MKRLRFALLTVFFVFLLSQLLLPVWTERAIEQSVHQNVAEVQSVKARVRVFPALMLLRGRADGIDIDARGVHVGDLVVHSVQLSGKALIFNPLALIRAQSIPLESASQLTVEVEITEDAIDDYLRRHVPELVDTVVTITREEAVLTGEIPLFGSRGRVDISGQFAMNRQAQLVFIPTVVRMDGAKLPDFLVSSLTGEIVLPIDFTESGLPLVFHRVEMAPGSIFLHGTMSGEFMP